MSATDGLLIDVRLEIDGFQLEARATCSDFPLLILGPSGSGKTTLLEVVAGLRPEARGMVKWNGELWEDDANRVHRPSRRRSVGFVSQSASLFPHMSVLQNVEYGQRWAERSVRRSRPAAASLLEELGVAHLAGRKAGTLSGGEAQRVTLARALAASPSLLLLDEPFAHLDPPTRSRAQETLDATLARHPVATIQVSHDRQELKRFARTVWLVMAGAVVQQGTLAEVLEKPVSDDIQTFLGISQKPNG